MVWNEETIRHLRDLWAQGFSTAEIGRRLSVSKNAIVGKAHRLELDARPSPIRRDGPKPEPERPAGCPRMGGPTLPPLASAGGALMGAPNVLTASGPLEVRFGANRPVRPVPAVLPRPMAVAPAAAPLPRAVVAPAPVQARRPAPSCCWPIGEPGTKTFRFCDDTSVPGKPYCDEHAKVAYVRLRDRREDAA